MAENVEEIATISQGMGFQLLEQGAPGAMFTGDVSVYRVTDDTEPGVIKVRITVDGDSLTLTLTAANAGGLADAINEAKEPSA